MFTLAVDTSSPQASVALTREGSLHFELDFQADVPHSSLVLPAIEWLLKTADLSMTRIDLFACAAGPGSFTGLRIGVATCLGLAAGLKKPVVGVSTLEAVAYPYAFEDHPVAAILDARKKQVFFQEFRWTEAAGLHACTPAVSIRPDRLAFHIKEKTILAGNGADLHRQMIAQVLGDKALFAPRSLCYHRAHVIALIALERYRKGGADAFPNLQYVRPSDAEIEMEKKGFENENGQRSKTPGNSH